MPSAFSLSDFQSVATIIFKSSPIPGPSSDDFDPRKNRFCLVGSPLQQQYFAVANRTSRQLYKIRLFTPPTSRSLSLDRFAKLSSTTVIANLVGLLCDNLPSTKRRQATLLSESTPHFVPHQPANSGLFLMQIMYYSLFIRQWQQLLRAYASSTDWCLENRQCPHSQRSRHSGQWHIHEVSTLFQR
jgi:hypothetical protein